MLTSFEQSRVRFYLGQSTLFRYRNPRLEGVWGALDSDAEEIVRETLVQLSAVDARIFGTDGNLGEVAEAAGVKSVEEIAFAGNGSGMDIAMRKIGRALVGRLSALLGVPVYADVYSGEGWPGDTYSATGGLNGRGGNQFGVG